MFLRCILFIVALSLVTGAAQAHAEDYVGASWPNLVRTMAHFKAIDLSDPALLDEYGIITECDLYKAFYKDDFKWHEVREAIKKSVAINIATFPTAYHYDVDLQLDRYDFTAKIYRLTEKSTLRNVNTFVLYAVEGSGCGAATIQLIPRIYRAVLAAPFYVDGLPLGEKDAQALLKQMSDDKNTDHVIYARFNLRVVYIEPLRKETNGKGLDMVTHYMQSNAPNAQTVRLDARLESVNFYEDAARTKLVYQFQP